MKIKNMLIASLFLVLLSGYMHSCKKVKDPTDGVKLIVNYDLITTTFSLRFYDAASGELIGMNDNKEVNVTITGEHAHTIIDISGLQKPSYKSTHGFIELAVDPAITVGPENPVNFTVVATIEGYLSTSQPIQLLKQEDNIFEIRMVNLENLPVGVTKVVNDEANADPSGKITGDIEVVTPAGNINLKIKGGTVLKNSEGEPLTGQLNIQLVHFSNLEDESLMAFPGGLNANVQMPGGEYERVFFFSAGFVALEITDAGGKVAETVENSPLELTMEIPEETYNPDKNTLVAEGDTLPVWSYEVETGEWVYESTDTVLMNNKGSYEVTSQMWHLSYWNWDWWWWWICTEGLIIDFVTDQYYCPCYLWVATVRNPVNNTLMWVSPMYACKNEPVVFYNAPGGIPVNISYNATCSNIYTELDFYYYENLCAPDLLEVYFYAEELGDIVTVDLQGYCENDPNFIIRPTVSYWIRKKDDWCYRYFELVNGYGQVCGVDIGATYVIGLYFDGEWYEHAFVIDNNHYVNYEIEIPGEVCSDVFGI